MKSIAEIVRPPYLGAAYYPEDWPREQMDYDIAKMKEAGVKRFRRLGAPLRGREGVVESH